MVVQDAVLYVPGYIDAVDLAMVAFAGNSLLWRLVLKNTGVDAASFTSLRIISGAFTL
jgi:hypothetical protein